MRRFLWLSVGALLLASIAVTSSGGATQAEARWVITDLGTLGGPSAEAVAINNRGQIVGWSDTKRVKNATTKTYIVHAFLWQDGKMTDIGVPGYDWSSATDINDLGEIVGNMGDSSISLGGRSFLLRNGKIRDLLGKDGEAQAINNQGDVVGSVGDPFYNGRCFIWRGGKARIFGRYCGALDLNEQGQVVGWVGVGFDAEWAAFRWQQGRMRNLGVFPGHMSDGSLFRAEGINEGGAIVGSEWEEVNVHGDVLPVRAFLWRNGKMTALGLPPGYHGGMAADINDSGQIVGSATGKGGAHAFLWENGTAHDLGALPGGSSEANAINNRGQVVGWSWTGERRHAVLWTLKR